MDTKTKDATHIEEPDLTRLESAAEKPTHDLGIKHFEEAANQATDVEHSMTVREAFRTYPMAAGWSVLFCMAIIMDGFDSSLITNLYGQPAFQRKYGKSDGEGGFFVTAPWQTSFAMASPIGRVLGGAIQGHIAERFGRKKTLLGCLVLIVGFIFITFFANSNEVLLVGQMLCGIIWGILTSLAPIYASEVCPLRLRDLLTAYVNLCWSIGQFIATGVLSGMADNNTQWAYRVPFALQWLWPFVIFTFIFWAPESPYWLVRHGKIDQAKRSLSKLIRKTEKINVEEMLALIQRTNEREAALEVGATYMGCFKGTNLRRTEISAMAWSIQILSGLSLPFYAVVFLQLAGFPADKAFDMNVGMNAMGFVGTCISFTLIPRFGRRTLYFGGLSILTGVMLIIGFLGLAPQSNAVINAQAALLLVWYFGYFLTVGPVAYVIFSETSATRLRSHTVAIALIAYSLFGIVYNVASPYLLGQEEADLGAKTALIYGGISLMACVWCYFRLPECKGRTYEELDIMFERKVPTRQFKAYVIDEN